MCAFVRPHAVAVDQCALPRAVHEVLNRRNRDDGCIRCHLSKPFRPECTGRVSRRSRLELDALPSRMHANARPDLLPIHSPDVQKRVDSVAVQGSAPRRPHEPMLAPASRNPDPAPLNGRRVRGSAGTSVDAGAPNGQVAQAPKNASTSTTGSTDMADSSDCEPILVRSNS